MSKQTYSNKDLLNKSLFKSHPLFEQWPDGLIVIDEKGFIFTVNDKTMALLGYEVEELEGSSLHSLLCGQAADYQHKEENCQFLNIEQALPINHIIDAWFIQKNGIYLHVDVKNVVHLSGNELFDKLFDQFSYSRLVLLLLLSYLF